MELGGRDKVNAVEAGAFVKEHLSQKAIVNQIAEEAAELSAAASKLARILDGENPSPVTLEEAYHSLAEEYGDVMNGIEVLTIPPGYADILNCRAEKLVRWAERIKKKNGGNRSE